MLGIGAQVEFLDELFCEMTVTSFREERHFGVKFHSPLKRRLKIIIIIPLKKKLWTDLWCAILSYSYIGCCHALHTAIIMIKYLKFVLNESQGNRGVLTSLAGIPV